jgi:transcriptional regulator with XRE-family HTH domain
LRLLCHLREARGDRTLAEMARASGVANANLSMIETGRMLPRDEWIEGMERAYGLEYGDGEAV